VTSLNGFAAVDAGFRAAFSYMKTGLQPAMIRCFCR
jgi:hypothetical protein